MRLPARFVLPAVGLAILVATGVPAGAEPVCTGTEEDAKICADPDALPGAGPGSGAPVSRCVYLPTETECRTVELPVSEPDVDPGRPEDVVTCTGPCASPVTDAAEAAAERVDRIREDAVDEHRECFSGVSVRRVVYYAHCMIRPV